MPEGKQAERSITFDEASHIYKVEGRIVPSVTQIIEAVRPNHRWYPAGAAERGSNVHLALRYLDEGRLAECPAELHGYLEAYELFKKQNDWMPLETERIVFSEEYGYIGRVDKIGLFRDLQAVVDFKSGVPDASHKVQAAAYGMAAGIANRFVLYLTARGSYKMADASALMYEKIWLAHLQVFDYYR